MQVTPSSDMNKLFAQVHLDNNGARVKKAPKPPRVQELTPIESVVDGSAFKPLKFNTGEPTCCLKLRCNYRYSVEEARALRDDVPKVGKDGCRMERNLYVQERTISLPGNKFQLYLGDVVKQEVCVTFFTMLTGVSTGLVYAARKTGRLTT